MPISWIPSKEPKAEKESQGKTNLGSKANKKKNKLKCFTLHIIECINTSSGQFSLHFLCFITFSKMPCQIATDPNGSDTIDMHIYMRFVPTERTKKEPPRKSEFRRKNEPKKIKHKMKMFHIQFIQLNNNICSALQFNNEFEFECNVLAIYLQFNFVSDSK